MRISATQPAIPARFPVAVVNVTPLIGILMVMLAVFMTAAPPPTNSLPLDVPPMDCFDTCPGRAPAFVTVQADGALFVADTPSSPQTLTRDVCTALGDSECRSRSVFVRGMADAPYGDFMDAMTALKDGGFTRVAILNEDIS